MLTVTGKSYRSGTSFARGTTIDEYLAKELCERLYAQWRTSWPEVLRFQGGIEGITTEMVEQVPVDELIAEFGQEDAETLLTVCKNNH